MSFNYTGLSARVHLFKYRWTYSNVWICLSSEFHWTCVPPAPLAFRWPARHRSLSWSSSGKLLMVLQKPRPRMPRTLTHSTEEDSSTALIAQLLQTVPLLQPSAAVGPAFWEECCDYARVLLRLTWALGCQFAEPNARHITWNKSGFHLIQTYPDLSYYL